MGPTVDSTFPTLKTVITKIPILALPDFSEQFVLETVALGMGIGVMLLQNERPLAFFNKALSPSARKSVYESELIVVVQAIKKW